MDNIPSWLLKDCSIVIAKPLSYIINLSLSTCIYPTDWKRSKVIPTYKSTASSDIHNYRPISVIPAISKIIEKVIHNRSTELAATQFIDNVKKKVNEGKIVGAVFLDLSKAFDMLSHDKLISKLTCYGLP